MNRIGIDIGSTFSKFVVLDSSDNVVYKKCIETGYNNENACRDALHDVKNSGFSVNSSNVGITGYGRLNTSFSKKAVTEITCHGIGASKIFNLKTFNVLDIGGQDTKIINVNDGKVIDFLMNDKCAAGTGRFLDIMSQRLGITISEMCSLAQKGSGVQISSLCAVFAESEVIGLMSSGQSIENICFAIVDSVAKKIKAQVSKKMVGDCIVLTGGLHNCSYLIELLNKYLSVSIKTDVLSQYAGAIGAALCA